MKRVKCKQCERMYVKINSLQQVCSYICALKFNSKKESDKRKNTFKKELRTRTDYLKILQQVFNRYIRERDKYKGCICCGKELKGVFDAGHFFSIGAHPNLRFEEDNVHGQTRHCNTYLHGNLNEYRKGLVKRIGEERLTELERRKNEPLKLSIDEIKELIKYYKHKLKTK